ncbi:MAG: TRZ/ATZ family hydrolase [Thauera sp.]|jgi:5-methylthioadenosine/S-adenosylhomocysteine deaminase|nr:TRZ/ATZ family hydrolase [Thauera sp.]
MRHAIDLLIVARWIIPVEPATLTLEDHAVAVDQGRIVAVLPAAEARSRFSARETVELPEHALIPGLVNAHTHAAMNLMRGLADDLPLMRWLQEAIWPAEARHADADFVHDGSLLAAAEMLRGGITTCNEMYFHPDAAARAFASAGLRAVIGLVVMEFPTSWAQSSDDYLDKGLAVADRWSQHPLLRFALAPHAPYTVSDDSFRRITALASAQALPLHIHIHETAQEVADSLASHGLRPLARLEQLGVLSERLIGVHAVHLDEQDIDLLVRHQCALVHCPTSNMKLGSGIAPLPRLLEHGLRIGLGSDGAASNNRIDLFQEMRHAALLAKVGSADAAALPAHQALHMATLGGAQAIGLGSEIGSIRPGKLADLCAVDLGGLLSQPCYDPVSHLVYVAGREQVSEVWVGGEARVAKGQSLLQISDKELLRLASLWQTRLAK